MNNQDLLNALAKTLQEHEEMKANWIVTAPILKKLAEIMYKEYETEPDELIPVQVFANDAVMWLDKFVHKEETNGTN